MKKEYRKIKYGKKVINYSVVYSKRKTLQIAVHPDYSVVITAPQNTEDYLIKTKIQKRAKWINKQLNYFKQFEPRTTRKYFLNGETHLYLGKRYRLKIISGLNEGVILKNGYFIVVQRDKENQKRTSELLNNWYLRKAGEKFTEYFDICWENFSDITAIKPLLRIRKMKTRWGSLSKKGTLTLNPELIKAPKECIEYVITHELCHTVYHNHSSQFYSLLERIIPDWKRIKHKLEINLS